MASTYVCEWMTRRVHTTIRQSAKIPSMMGDEKTVATREGTYFNRLNGGLDLETYKALCADTADVVLETIYYCQSELGSLGKSLYESRKILNPNFDPDEEKRRLINHDYLILKIQSGPCHPHTWQPPIYIFAEKVGEDEKNKAGIYITKFEKDPADIDTKYALHSIDCRSTRFGSLLNLVGILKICSPHYDVIHNNCWDYAFSTTKLLLEKCIQISKECGGAEEEREGLHAELNHLEANILQKHACNQVKRVANFVTTSACDALEYSPPSINVTPISVNPL